LVIVGPPRSGKGTIFRVIEELVGPAHVASPRLSGLTDDKTLSSLIGKSACLIADMRATSGKTPAIAEALLGISGQDIFTIDRKYKDAWRGRLGTFVVMASNELPTLRDASGALPGRYLPLLMTESWAGREDRTLQPRLLDELPGILNRALEGLGYVEKNGRFTEPKVSAEAVEDMAEMASPMKRFVEERLIAMPKGADPDEYMTEVTKLFNDYKVWADANDEPRIPINTFGQRLRSALPSIRRSQPREGDGKRASSYAGVRLRHRETVQERANREAFTKMHTLTGGGLRVIKGGDDGDNA
jgi:putative DNA primase/helicase